MEKSKKITRLNACLRLLLGIVALCSFPETMATEFVRSLPRQVEWSRGKTLVRNPKENQKRIENEEAEKLLLPNQEIVFIQTTDNEYFKLPNWQINYMPVLANKISQQSQKNSLLHPFDTSQINGGITSQELQLLSDTWVQMKGNGVLPFLKTLSPDAQSLLNSAAKKVGSAILYGATSDYLLPRELHSKLVEPLIDPLIKLLKKSGAVELQKERSFPKVSHKWLDNWNSDRTKRVGVRGEQLLLYDIANNFEFQVAKITNLPPNMWYTFSSDGDGRMIVGIPYKTADSRIICWDTQDQFKQYAIPYSGFIGRVVLSSDAKTLAFTCSDQKVEVKTPATKLYVCYFTEDNPQPKQLTWVEGGIESIDFSPDGKQLACFSKAKLLLYDSLDNFKAQEVISDGRNYFISSITFDPKGTKFICLLKKNRLNNNNPLDGRSQLSLYLLSGKNYVFNRRVPFYDDVLIDFDINGDACIAEPYGGQGRVCYWNKLSHSDSKPQEIGYVHDVGRSKLSPDGKIYVFAGINELCFLYTDDLEQYYYLIKEVKGDVRSIRFSPDSKKCVILIHTLDQLPGYTSEYVLKIDEWTCDFDFQDLKQCNVGQAETLYSLYYRKFLKHTLKNETPENIENVTKGTLSYEIFNSLPVALQEKMKSILGITVVDKHQEDEKKQRGIQAIPYQEVAEVAQKNLREYLEKQKDQIDHIKGQMKKEAEQKADNNQSIKAKEPKAVVQDYNQQQNVFWKTFSDFGESIYRRLPVWMQKLIKERKPTNQELQHIQK